MQDVQKVAEAKQRLRATLLQNRRNRDAVDLRRARAAVADVVLACARDGRWTCVAAYEPMRTEPGSSELLARLAELGIEVLVPLTLPDHDLDWARWPTAPVTESPDAVVGGLGIEAIGRAQSVLVPALAVGRDGMRLGRGGGSYDRALLRCRPGAQRIALVFADEVLDAVPTERWDVPVNAAVTPSGWLALGGPLAGNTAVTPGD